MGHVRAGVDDADLDRARGPEDLLGHLVLAGGDVLPLVREAWTQHRRERGLAIDRRASGRWAKAIPGRPRSWLARPASSTSTVFM